MLPTRHRKLALPLVAFFFTVLFSLFISLSAQSLTSLPRNWSRHSIYEPLSPSLLKRWLCFLQCACEQIMTYDWLMCESTEGTWWKAEDRYSGSQYLGFINWHIGRRKVAGTWRGSRDKLRHTKWASIHPDKDNDIHGNSTALLVFRMGKVARGDGLVTHVWH